MERDVRGASFSEELQNQIWHRDKGVCVYCKTEPGVEIDHVVPRSKGGPAIRANGVLACKSCNRFKAGKILFDWAFIAFFHLLDHGESLSWLDELWQTQMSPLREHIPLISQNPTVLLNIMPSDRMAESDKTKLVCRGCEDAFSPKRSWQKFCSTYCRMAYWGKSYPRGKISPPRPQSVAGLQSKRPVCQRLFAGLVH